MNELTPWELYKRNPSICWEMMRYVRPRECAFICPDNSKLTKRFISIGVYKFLMNYLYKYYSKLEKYKFHFFASIEYVKKSLDGHHLNLKDDWLVWGFDCIFDVDSEGGSVEERFNKSHATAKKIVKVLRKDKMPFTIKFSGSKGFHMAILWEGLKEKYKPEEYGVINKQLASEVFKKAKVETCRSTFSKGHDLIRVPFSVHPSTGLLCLPLTLKEFNNFKPEMATIENNINKDFRGVIKEKGVIR